MQCKNDNDSLVSDFLITEVSFEQGTKVCFTSEQGKGLNPVTTTTKGICKRQAEFFLFLKKKSYWKKFLPDQQFFLVISHVSTVTGCQKYIIYMQYQTPEKIACKTL